MRKVFPTLGLANCVPMPEGDRLKNSYLHFRFAAAAPRNHNSRGVNPAARALASAREAVRAGDYAFAPRYAGATRQKDGLTYVENPQAFGLRFVGRVEAEPGRRNGYFSHRQTCGWFTDPFGDVFKDGSGLCYGVVYQLPARRGRVRLVAGYQFGGYDGGPCLDLSEVFEADERDSADWHSIQDHDKAEEAARRADELAKDAAEKEREYQTAYAAGRDYADKETELKVLRKNVLSILAERKDARADQAKFPALCAAIRDRVQSLLDVIEQLRKERDQLKAGDNPRLCFWPGDDVLKAAFNEGAGRPVLGA